MSLAPKAKSHNFNLCSFHAYTDSARTYQYSPVVLTLENIVERWLVFMLKLLFCYVVEKDAFRFSTNG